MCHLFIVTSAVQFSDAFLSCLQVLASSQTDVGARESKSRSEGKEGSGALGLSAVRRAMVEWSINLGGDVSYSPLLVSLLSSTLFSYSILSSPTLSSLLLYFPSLLSPICHVLSSRLFSSPLFSSLLSYSLFSLLLSCIHCFLLLNDQLLLLNTSLSIYYSLLWILKWISLTLFSSLYHFSPLSHSLTPSLISLSLSSSTLIS